MGNFSRPACGEVSFLMKYFANGNKETLIATLLASIT